MQAAVSNSSHISSALFSDVRAGDCRSLGPEALMYPSSPKLMRSPFVSVAQGTGGEEGKVC